MRVALCSGSVLLAAVLGLHCSYPSSPSTEAPEFPEVRPPAGFPPIPLPPDNPLTPERIALGRLLFYDSALSPTGTVACASCHRQQYAFADSRPLSSGTHSRKHWRNTPSLANAAYVPTLLRDGASNSLEQEILAVLTSPLGFGWTDTTALSNRLQQHPSYREAFRRAFGAVPSAMLTAKALAAFVRALLSGSSPYDRFRAGDSSALSPQQRQGMQLFFRVGCAECHPPPLFTDHRFHCNGLLAHYWDAGRAAVTGRPADYARFRTPSLRNVAATAPYLHDGSLGTLHEVLQRYNRGGYPVASKDPRIRPLGLSAEEVEALAAFLHSLTDSSLLHNPLYGPPR
ncbi:MAG: cytochrome c peroxidase [Chlorobiota bacterium]